MDDVERSHLEVDGHVRLTSGAYADPRSRDGGGTEAVDVRGYERYDPVDELKAVATTLKQLPPRPWRATERSHLEVHGPQEWDPVEQPDREAHERTEQARRERTSWRGIVDADGRPLVGEPVDQRTPPRDVVHGVWRDVAGVPTLADRAVSAARVMWQMHAEEKAGATTTPVEPSPPETVVDLSVAARACYEAVPDPTGRRWETVTAGEKEEWAARASVVLAVAGVGFTD